MRILHVHDVDYAGTGGGAIAMYRLHRGLRNAEVNSRILCRTKKLEASLESTAIPRGRFLGHIEYRLGQITSRLGLNDVHNLSTFNIKKMDVYLQTDILHLHCIHGGFFNYLALPRLTATKPALFTLHDMWAFTGHCAYSYDCDRWKIGCGKCPYSGTYPPIRRDATHIEWKLKDWVYRHSNIVVVSPSSWMTALAKQSMLNRFPIHQIPNGLDTQTYRPHDPQQCRSLLGIPPGKKVLMFAAINLRDRRKGGDLLLKALQGLPESLKVETVLLTIGDRADDFAKSVGIHTIHLGYVRSDRLKAIAYSAADLFVFPTRADNLPLVLHESMACGTPMVSFKVGGVPDLVRSGITGYLAEPESAKDLCEGIVRLLEDEQLRRQMSRQCRAVALKEYPVELQVQRYIQLYQQLLQKTHPDLPLPESWDVGSLSRRI